MASTTGTKRSYGLRNNPRPSARLADSMYVQDHEPYSCYRDGYQQKGQRDKRRRENDTLKPRYKSKSSCLRQTADVTMESARITGSGKQCSTGSSTVNFSAVTLPVCPGEVMNTAAAAFATMGFGGVKMTANTPADAALGGLVSQGSSTFIKMNRCCHNCGTHHSPGNTWRKGPTGERTLCNKCGLRFTRHGFAAPDPPPAMAPARITCAGSTGSGGSTSSVVLLPITSTQAAPATASQQAEVSSFSDCSFAAPLERKPRAKPLKQTTLEQQQQQPLRRSSRQQGKRTRKDAGLTAASAEHPTLKAVKTQIIKQKKAEGREVRACTKQAPVVNKPEIFTDTGAADNASEGQEQLEAAQGLLELTSRCLLEFMAIYDSEPGLVCRQNGSLIAVGRPQSVQSYDRLSHYLRLLSMYHTTHTCELDVIPTQETLLDACQGWC